jgi:hypothetical protein
VRIIYLKSRRVGVSAATAAQYFHSTPFHAGQHCAVIAHDQQTANNLFGFYTTFSRHYKPFGGVIKLPQMVKDAEGSVGWANGSWVRVSTARNVNFGRSFNLRRVQLDEFAFYDDPSKLMTSIMAAVPKDADTMVIIPSTANGVGNEFHKLWLRASDPANHSEWLAVFFAWWEHPANRLPLAIPGDRFQHSLDAEEREIKAKYNLDLEQLNWRRWVIENDFHGDVGKFRQEHPGCPEEAFIASGRLRFDVQAIGRMPVQRDAVQGGLEEIHVGIEKRLAFLPRERGELTLFRRPQPGLQRGPGAQSRHRGAGGDRTRADAAGGVRCVPVGAGYLLQLRGDRAGGERRRHWRCGRVAAPRLSGAPALSPAPRRGPRSVGARGPDRLEDDHGYQAAAPQ